MFRSSVREAMKRKMSIMRSPDESRRPDVPLQVIRPDNPELALQIAKIALDKQDGALLGRLPAEVGGYTFMGYAAMAPQRKVVLIVDLEMKVLGEMQRGDSFVTGVQLAIGSSFAADALGLD
jgi:hypothetical protein